jgi:hypothetical protein
MSDRAIENLAISVILSVLGCVAAWIIWVIAANIRRSRTSKHIVDLHSKLLDRFVNSNELMAYLEGEAGKRFFESLTLYVRDSMSRILNSMQAGVVLLLLGVAFLGLHSTQHEPWIRQTLLLAGVPTGTIGAGLLISAFFAFRLCRRWGLLKDRGNLD